MAQLFSLGSMNPFGIFSVVQASIDAVGEMFGRKPKPEPRKERISFALAYVLLLVLGVIAIWITIRQIYF